MVTVMNLEKWQNRFKRLRLVCTLPVSTLLAKDPIYIYHHIPKSGGMSIIEALESWFIVRHDHSDTFYSGESDPEFVNNPYDLSSFRSYQCLCGHFGTEEIYLHNRYPMVADDSRFRLFSFIRDPLETKTSLYYFEKKRGLDGGHTLAEHLGGRHNYIASRFPCTEENYKEILNRYFFIGITERAQESLDMLAKLLNKPRVKLKRVNTTSRDDEYAQLTDEIKNKFKRENRLDYLIYDYCVKRFESDCECRTID